MWWQKTSVVPAWGTVAEQWLTAEESDRFDGFRVRRDAERFLGGTLLLKGALSVITGRDPSRTSLSRRCECGQEHGRPRDVDGTVHLSLSHSEGLMVVAASLVAPLGVDVERVPSRCPVELFNSVVARGDVSPTTAGEFAQLWCRKEAWLKATGEGLRTAMNQVAISPGNNVLDMQTPEYGYRAAIATLQGTPKITVGDVDELLRRFWLPQG